MPTGSVNAGTVHPHLRGDRWPVAHESPRWFGSPPPAWGPPRGHLMIDTTTRFTPTCVGTAGRLHPAAPREPVHPHLRGDRSDIRGYLVLRSGSPPPAWGPRRAPPLRWPRPRFTPTCVGTADERTALGLTDSVHPHLRGDRARASAPSTWSAGSPPPAWGPLELPDLLRDARRFTPTCVGTAARPTPAPAAASVHPHLRGDRSPTPSGPRQPAGSPPPAWGPLRRVAQVAGQLRFTPTCVGTAPTAADTRMRASVHPHLRGDRPGGDPWPALKSGSPPPAWGPRPLAPPASAVMRFTPTCVGTALPHLHKRNGFTIP